MSMRSGRRRISGIVPSRETAQPFKGFPRTVECVNDIAPAFRVRLFVDAVFVRVRAKTRICVIACARHFENLKY
jgi:hypothetical protein